MDENERADAMAGRLYEWGAHRGMLPELERIMAQASDGLESLGSANRHFLAAIQSDTPDEALTHLQRWEAAMELQALEMGRIIRGMIDVVSRLVDKDTG